MLGAVSTEKKIKESEQDLSQSIHKQQAVSQKLDEIAKQIKNAENDNRKLNQKLERLGDEYTKNEVLYQDLKQKLVQYDASLLEINQNIQMENSRYLNLLSKHVSVIYAMNQIHEPTIASIIRQEVYAKVKDKNEKSLALLKRQINKKKIQKEDIFRSRQNIKKEINHISAQREEYIKEDKEQERLLEKLNVDEDAYRNRLQNAMDEQSSLRATLADLNILHKQEVEEERRREAEQKAAMLAEKKRKQEARKARELARKKAVKEGKKAVYIAEPEPKALDDDGGKEGMRNTSASYHADKVYAYSGGKTISPISGASLVKGFGTYVDPIYKIKIFNESVTLKAPSSDAKVYSVLNGRVVFAGDSSMLGKVVVVAHSNKMHTVYAGLSKIAPNISVGSSIQRGYVVGKVTSKLIFEATQNSKHIDPMKLISL
jgi:murein DD-endopeptidase MepM/ murein hydrolase activator NlpD